MDSTTYMLPAGGLGEWCNWLIRRRRLVRVTGRSMLPLLQPGDLLFVAPDAYRTASPQLDDLVVAHHPHQPQLKIIKRIGHILSDGRYVLRSDNPAEGSDSRTFGPVDGGAIVGRVTGRAIGR